MRIAYYPKSECDSVLLPLTTAAAIAVTVVVVAAIATAAVAAAARRHRRVHSRVLNVSEFVTSSEPFVESRSHLTVVTNTSIQFTNATFVVCHHFVIRLV